MAGRPVGPAHPHMGAMQQMQQQPPMARKIAHQTNGFAQDLSMANEKAWVTIGMIAEMMEDDESTILAYEKALSHNRMNTTALFSIGTCYERKEEYAKAADVFRGLTTINSTHGEAWGHLGYCYLMQNDLTNSYSSYQHALYHIQNAKNPQLWYGIGMLYDRYGSLDHAQEAFEAVLTMEPRHELLQEVQFRLGIISKQRGHLDEALDRLRSVLESVSNAEIAGDIYSQIGHVYELKNEIDYAKAAYQKVVEHCPNNSKALQQLGWLCLKQQNENASAVEYLKKAVSADPKDGKAWYLLGRCHMTLNEYEEAYHAYKQAVNHDPQNPNTWCSLGVLFYQLSQYLDALDAYSRAINLNPNICEVWYNVGALYDTCNQTSDARDAYQKAAELGADSQFIRDRLEMLRAKERGAPISAAAQAPPGPSEPPTTAPMGVSPPAKPSSQFQGGAPAPLMPTPTTGGPMNASAGHVSHPMTLASADLQSRGSYMSQQGNGRMVPTMARNAPALPPRGSSNNTVQLAPRVSPTMNMNHGSAPMMAAQQRGPMPGMRQVASIDQVKASRKEGDGPQHLAALDAKALGAGRRILDNRSHVSSRADAKDAPRR